MRPVRPNALFEVLLRAVATAPSLLDRAHLVAQGGHDVMEVLAVKRVHLENALIA